MESSRYKKILSLALPIIGGMISQNILNLVDTAMVGSLGNAALAAAGLGGFAAFMGQSLVLGISTGVQAITSRRKGERLLSQTAYPLNTGLLLVLALSLVLSTVFYFATPSLYPLLNSDLEVISLGAPYLQIRFLGIVFVGCNFAFRGYWNGIGLSKIYLFSLITMHTINIILNYGFIYGNLGLPQLGVSGAALGTTLSTAFGTCLYFALGITYARKSGFLKSTPKKEDFKALIQLSLPSSIQQLFFAGGFTAFFWIIGKVGTIQLAAIQIIINVMLLAILPGLGLGLAAATLVGQSLGQKSPQEAFAWGNDVMKIGAIGLGLIGLPMFFFSNSIFELFIHDPATIAMGKLPMQLTGLTISTEGIGLILMNALTGAGDTKAVMKISIFLQWCLFLPLAYFACVFFHLGLLEIWILHTAYRMALSLVYFLRWHRKSWQTIEI